MTSLNINDAIDIYPISSAQKIVLKAIIGFDKAIPTSTIVKVSGLTQQTCYHATTKLLEKGIITRTKHTVYVFKINSVKLSEIIAFYKHHIILERSLQNNK